MDSGGRAVLPRTCMTGAQPPTEGNPEWIREPGSSSQGHVGEEGRSGSQGLTKETWAMYYLPASSALQTVYIPGWTTTTGLLEAHRWDKATFILTLLWF